MLIRKMEGVESYIWVLVPYDLHHASIFTSLGCFTILVKLCWLEYPYGRGPTFNYFVYKRTNGCSFLIETNLHNFSSFCEWSLHSLVICHNYV
jgi:hypothetical protein